MRAAPVRQWIDVGYWLLIASSAPALLLIAYFVLARQWVRWFGRPATATVVEATRVATLPHIITQLALAVTPLGEPAYVRISMRVRWSEHTVDPARLTVGSQLPVRYRLARQPIVMPDARRQERHTHG